MVIIVVNEFVVNVSIDKWDWKLEVENMVFKEKVKVFVEVEMVVVY